MYPVQQQYGEEKAAQTEWKQIQEMYMEENCI